MSRLLSNNMNNILQISRLLEETLQVQNLPAGDQHQNGGLENGPLDYPVKRRIRQSRVSILPLAHVLLVVRHGLQTAMQPRGHFQQVERQSIVRPDPIVLQAPHRRDYAHDESHLPAVPVLRGVVIVRPETAVLHA